MSHGLSREQKRARKGNRLLARLRVFMFVSRRVTQRSSQTTAGRHTHTYTGELLAAGERRRTVLGAALVIARESSEAAAVSWSRSPGANLPPNVWPQLLSPIPFLARNWRTEIAPGMARRSPRVSVASSCELVGCLRASRKLQQHQR